MILASLTAVSLSLSPFAPLALFSVWRREALRIRKPTEGKWQSKKVVPQILVKGLPTEERQILNMLTANIKSGRLQEYYLRKLMGEPYLKVRKWNKMDGPKFALRHRPFSQVKVTLISVQWTREILPGFAYLRGRAGREARATPTAAGWRPPGARLPTATSSRSSWRRGEVTPKWIRRDSCHSQLFLRTSR